MADSDSLTRNTSFQSTGSLRKDIKCISRGNIEGAGKNLPPSKAVTDSEKMDFCIEAVPGWAALPDAIMVATKKFTSGISSSVCKVFLHGPGAEAVQPNACVYRFMGNLKESDKHPLALQYNDNFVVAAGELGVAEKIYATKGMHRCTEFCSGKELFGGEDAHFLAAMFDGKMPPMTDDNCPANGALMNSLGKAIGALHSMPLTWLSSVISSDEFAKLQANPTYFPLVVADEIIGISKSLRDRTLAYIPKDGWFAKPVSCHTDLHGANIILLDDGSSNIRIIDWEGLCAGYRGFDLAYFFLNCPGSTLESRRSFARGYMSSSAQTLTDKSIDSFLLDIEKCMPLALAANVAFVTFIFPIYRPSMMKLLKKTLQALEQHVNGKTSDEVLEHSNWIIEDGLVQRLLREGAASTCCCLLL